MSDKDEFEYRDKITAEQAAEYISQLAEGLRSRTVTLLGRGQVLKLTPEDLVKVKVKANREEDKSKLELAISWKAKYAATVDKLAISAGDTPGIPPTGYADQPEVISKSRGKTKIQEKTDE